MRLEQIGEISVYLGDCLEILPQLKCACDCCITDLPYGMIDCEWDQVIPFDRMWNALEHVMKKNAPVLLFSSQPFTTDLICSNREKFKYHLIWKKNVPTGMSSAKYRPMKYHEEILVFNTDASSTYNPIMKPRVGVGKECYNYEHYCGKSNHVNLKKIKKHYDPENVQPSSVLEFDVVPNRSGKIHPTQKPVELIEYLVRTYSNENDVVLDFTAGSGTTGIACMKLNRKCILIEKDVKYFDAACDRIRNHYNIEQNMIF